MKRVNKIKLLLFFTIASIIFAPVHWAFGCSPPPKCYPGVTINCSDYECSDCDWCILPTSPPEEPSESITGQITNPFLPDRLKTLYGTTFLGKFINLGISLIFIVGTIIFFFMLVSGGVRWISGGSDKVKLEGAQKQITHALVGLAILFMSFAIIQLVESLFGLSLLNISLPTL